MKHIKPNTMVILDIPDDCLQYASHYEQMLGVPSGQGSGSLLLCLGEIKNMKGHYTFVNITTGKFVVGLHSTWFRKPTDAEL